MTHSTAPATPAPDAGSPPPQQELSRYDKGQPRQSIRRGRERGVWVFVPAAELREAGLDPADDAPTYKVWGRKGGQVLVRLYRKR